MTNISQMTFDHVENLQASLSLDDILKYLTLAGNDFGYENFSISGVPNPNEKIDPYVILCGWPGDWASRYLEKEYVKYDPVINNIRSSSMPFMWQEAALKFHSTENQKVMHEAKEFGLVDGFSTPIYSTHGFQAIVTFGAKKLLLSKEQKAALHLISIYAHNKARSLLPDANIRLEREIPALTAREIETLKWSASGKTAWEISVILSISQRTVEQYITSAAMKLHSVNRTQAVAEALRLQIIQ